MTDLDGKVVIVSGAASGIGLDCATAFVEQGALVVLTDLKQQAGVDAAARLGGRACFLLQDVTDERRWAEVVTAVIDRFGRLDILVNSAGLGLFKDIEATSLEEFRRIQAVNLDSVFLGCKAVLPAMRGSGGGSIINVSSIAGLRGVAKLAAYNAAKGAVRMLTKSVALHCAERGYNIRCNSVHPSYVETPMVRTMIETASDPSRLEATMTRVSPAGRFARPREISNVILFLASDESSFINGAEIPVDGGATAR